MVPQLMGRRLTSECRMRHAKILFLILFWTAIPLNADIVEGNGYSFFLSAPLGWVLDKSVSSDDESDAVLYPQGTTYRNAPSILYVSIALKGDGFKDLPDLLQQDAQWGSRQGSQFHLRNGPRLQTRLKKAVPVYLYLGLKDGTSEATAYVDEKEVVVVFTLSSSNEQILHEDLPALQTAVESYEFIGKSGENLE